jgi:hypothetical protein
MQILPSGAAGSGFINSSAGLILVVLAVGVLFAIGPVRETMTDLWKQLVSYFMGPSPDEADREKQDDAQPDGTESVVTRASEKDSYDFDLSVLAIGNDATSDNTKT